MKLSDLKSLQINKETLFKPGAGKGTGRTIVLIGAGALFFGLVYLGVYALTHRPIAVKVMNIAPARPYAVAPLLTAGGYVISKHQLTIGAKIQGRIQALKVKEGDHVERGTLLATLDDSEQKAQHDLAKASLEQAVRDFERGRQLLAEKIISQAEYDKLEADRNVKKAQLDLAQAQWDNTQIVSPIVGIVAEKIAEVGEVTSPVTEIQASSKTGIFKLYDPSHLQVEMDISEADIGKVKIGQAAVVSVDAARGKPYRAEVEEIMPIANRQKATVKVKVRLESPDEMIKPEMSAKVNFVSKETKIETQTETKILLPAASLYSENGKNWVFIVDGNKARRRIVESGETFGNSIEIKAGLREGDRVIVGSDREVRDGARIKEK